MVMALLRVMLIWSMTRELNKHLFLKGIMPFSILSSMERTTWIMDSGVSTHFCSTPELFSYIYKLKKPVEVHLPDGSSNRVLSAGNMKLNKDIILVDVLYIPGFTHNLLSVAQLI